jgi:hypothetical protein
MNSIFPFLAAITAAPEKIPDLKPVRGAIPPTLWEEHGWALCFLGAVALVLLILIICRLRQPKPVVAPTSADIVRHNLKALRGREDAAHVNTEAARLLRGFLIAKFNLAGPGLTADEIAGCLPTDEGLAAELHRFLHYCDVMNFAPVLAAPPTETAIEDALALVDSVERRTPPPLVMSQPSIVRAK